MNYKTIRDATLARIEALKPTKVSRIEQYQGQVDTMASEPDEWQPMCRYILVQAQGSQFDSSNKSSMQDLNVRARIVLYLGINEGLSAGELEDEMFDLIDEISALNAAYLFHEGNNIGRLRHVDDSYEMTLDNHLIWTMTFELLTQVREG